MLESRKCILRVVSISMASVVTTSTVDSQSDVSNFVKSKVFRLYNLIKNMHYLSQKYLHKKTTEI